MNPTLRQAPANNPPLVEVHRLAKRFPAGRALLPGSRTWLQAVDDISFAIHRGETLALVGESGSGKTTVARLILGLIQPSEGAVYFAGQDVATFSAAQRKALRRKAQIIFQDPFSALDPRMRVGTAIEEGLRIHLPEKRQVRMARVVDILQRVGLDPSLQGRFPHELSGGQRQRVVIARALALEPEFLIADEPLSALDMSIQAQILNLLGDLKTEFDLTFLIISHDLAVVEHLADRIAVMYLGEISEQGPAEQVLDHPQHPYTRMLLAAVPTLRGGSRLPAPVQGELPSLTQLPDGCRFHPRCEAALPGLCSTSPPPAVRAGTDHQVNCWLYAGNEPD